MRSAGWKTPRRLWLAAMFVVACPLSLQAAGDGTAGRETAIKWCSRCHVIGDYNPMGGINSTPSFWIMARKPETYSAKVLTFQERRPHASLEFDLTDWDVEDIHAYIRTLKQE